MKKFKYLFILVLFMVLMPRVYASSVSTSLTGTNTIRVGNTTTIYVKLNSSGGIRGVDLTYSTSGNISVVSATVVGLTEQSRNGNRVLSYSQNALQSGSSVFAIKVKGTSVGTGTVSVSNVKATVDGETATGNNASITITSFGLTLSTNTSKNLVQLVWFPALSSAINGTSTIPDDVPIAIDNEVALQPDKLSSHRI